MRCNRLGALLSGFKTIISNGDCSIVTLVYTRPLSSTCLVRYVASFPISILCQSTSGLLVVSRYPRDAEGTWPDIGPISISVELPWYISRVRHVNDGLHLSGSIRPSDVTTCAMNRTSSCLSLNLSTFSLTPRSSHRCRNEWSRLSWSTFASSTVLP